MFKDMFFNNTNTYLFKILSFESFKISKLYILNTLLMSFIYHNGFKIAMENDWC